MTDPVEKFLFSRKEAAHCLGLSVRSIDYFLSRGVLDFKMVGTKKLITRDSLRRFARAHHVGPIGRAKPI